MKKIEINVSCRNCTATSVVSFIGDNADKARVVACAACGSRNIASLVALSTICAADFAPTLALRHGIDGDEVAFHRTGKIGHDMRTHAPAAEYRHRDDNGESRVWADLDGNVTEEA